MRSVSEAAPPTRPGSPATALAVTRRFIDVAGRQVHTRIAGQGPPALFVHSSPANSAMMLSEMAGVADRFTCFAFDTPGFGLSDPLPGDVLTVADLADALAETLKASALPPCPVFGCHTGAAIALELARRHPSRVTGLVLDGLACFDAEEFARIDTEYFRKFPVDPLGGHYSSIWTRFRDQSIWFPWFSRDPADLNDSDLTSPAATDRWVTMFFAAQETYAPAYRAAMAYREGPQAVRELTVPAVLTAVESDMLYPHLDRVAEVAGDSSIRRVGPSLAARRAVMGEAFDRFGSPGTAPVLDEVLRGSERIVRGFADMGSHQVLFRTMGDPGNPPVLVIPDVPGAGGGAEARMADLAAKHFAIAFDLPGCGETAPLAQTSLEAYAACLWQACAALGIERTALFGIGFGSSLALAMAAAEPVRTVGLTLEGLLLADLPVRETLRAHYAPEIALQPDGSHWFRTWQMLRDMELWWPWFTPTRAALRRVAGDFDGVRLHRRTCETRSQPGGHAAYVAAAIAQDAAVVVAALARPPRFVAGSSNPLASAFDEAARALFPAAAWIEPGGAQ